MNTGMKNYFFSVALVKLRKLSKTQVSELWPKQETCWRWHLLTFSSVKTWFCFLPFIVIKYHKKHFSGNVVLRNLSYLWFKCNPPFKALPDDSAVVINLRLSVFMATNFPHISEISIQRSWKEKNHRIVCHTHAWTHLSQEEAWELPQ